MPMHCMCVHVLFCLSIQSVIDTELLFYLLTIVNSAVMNIDVTNITIIFNIFELDSFLNYILQSRIAGSYGNSL